jgi:peptidoglycan/LPS O-acetylase OafA/YrhL
VLFGLHHQSGLTRVQSHKYRLGYRSDIEGLRAIAILLVVAAHARVVWLAGGFVGVDVFFVLSGYLITGLLMQEILSNHRLHYAAFYARRLLRLLPGLLLMLSITGLMAWMLIAAGEQSGQATAAASAMWWSSNLYFAFARMDYFSPGTETNLFLHTWSLGVEEQFYLAWPVLLVLVLGIVANGQRVPRLKLLNGVLLGVLGISLVIEVVWTRSAPHLAFYLMPARAWQFALGGLVFLNFAEPTSSISGLRKFTDRSLLQLWGGWLGLLLIVIGAVIIGNTTPYPGLWALLPSTGAAMVLMAGVAVPRMGVGRLLSLPPLQALGRVSYSWYLWHWPVLLLGGTVISMFSGMNRLALIILSLFIATLSYRYVESPIRQNRRLVTHPLVTIFVAVTLMALAASLAFYWRNIAGKQMSLPGQMQYIQARFDAPVIYSMGCDDHYHSADLRTCKFGASHARHTAVIIGDSIGLQWFPAAVKVFDKPDWQLLVLTKSACPMVDVPVFYSRIGRDYTECTVWRNRALQKIQALKPEIVILGSTDTYNFSQTQWSEGTFRVLKAISPYAIQVYVLRSTPELPFDGPSCLTPRIWHHGFTHRGPQCIADAHSNHANEVFRWEVSAVSRFGNVTPIDMTEAVCPNGKCHAEMNGTIVFRDTHHLTATFAASLSNKLKSHLELSP